LIAKNLGKAERQRLNALKKENNTRYYLYLKQIVEQNNINLKNFEFLNLYFKYLSFSADINTNLLVDEERKLQDKIYGFLIITEEQKDLVKFEKVLNFYENFINNSVTSKEALDFIANEKEYADFIVQFLNRNSAYLIWAYSVNKQIATLQRAMVRMGDFYQSAEERNNVLVANTLDKKEKISVMVLGGYHTDGVTQLLRARDISYILISPNISKDYDTKIYENRLLREAGIVKVNNPMEVAQKLGNDKLALVSMFQAEGVDGLNAEALRGRITAIVGEVDAGTIAGMDKMNKEALVTQLITIMNKNLIASELTDAQLVEYFTGMATVLSEISSGFKLTIDEDKNVKINDKIITNIKTLINMDKVAQSLSQKTKAQLTDADLVKAREFANSQVASPIQLRAALAVLKLASKPEDVDILSKLEGDVAKLPQDVVLPVSAPAPPSGVRQGVEVLLNLGLQNPVDPLEGEKNKIIEPFIDRLITMGLGNDLVEEAITKLATIKKMRTIDELNTEIRKLEDEITQKLQKKQSPNQEEKKQELITGKIVFIPAHFYYINKIGKRSEFELSNGNCGLAAIYAYLLDNGIKLGELQEGEQLRSLFANWYSAKYGQEVAEIQQVAFNSRTISPTELIGFLNFILTSLGKPVVTQDLINNQNQADQRVDFNFEAVHPMQVYLLRQFNNSKKASENRAISSVVGNDVLLDSLKHKITDITQLQPQSVLGQGQSGPSAAILAASGGLAKPATPAPAALGQGQPAPSAASLAASGGILGKPAVAPSPSPSPSPSALGQSQTIDPKQEQAGKPAPSLQGAGKSSPAPAQEIKQYANLAAFNSAFPGLNSSLSLAGITIRIFSMDDKMKTNLRNLNYKKQLEKKGATVIFSENPQPQAEYGAEFVAKAKASIVGAKYLAEMTLVAPIAPIAELVARLQPLKDVIDESIATLTVIESKTQGDPAITELLAEIAKPENALKLQDINIPGLTNAIKTQNPVDAQVKLNIIDSEEVDLGFEKSGNNWEVTKRRLHFLNMLTPDIRASYFTYLKKHEILEASLISLNINPQTAHNKVVQLFKEEHQKFERLFILANRLLVLKDAGLLNLEAVKDFQTKLFEFNDTSIEELYDAEKRLGLQQAMLDANLGGFYVIETNGGTLGLGAKQIKLPQGVNWKGKTVVLRGQITDIADFVEFEKLTTQAMNYGGQLLYIPQEQSAVLSPMEKELRRKNIIRPVVLSPIDGSIYSRPGTCVDQEVLDIAKAVFGPEQVTANPAKSAVSLMNLAEKISLGLPTLGIEQVILSKFNQEVLDKLKLKLTAKIITPEIIAQLALLPIKQHVVCSAVLGADIYLIAPAEGQVVNKVTKLDRNKSVTETLLSAERDKVVVIQYNDLTNKAEVEQAKLAPVLTTNPPVILSSGDDMTLLGKIMMEVLFATGKLNDAGILSQAGPIIQTILIPFIATKRKDRVLAIGNALAQEDVDSVKALASAA
jgi:hypothetical protein